MLTCQTASVAAAALLLALSVQYVLGATATTNFTVQMTITDDCTVTTTGALNFGSSAAINANVDGTTTISVQCTNGTGYTIGLNGGSTANNVSARKMTSGSATIDYSLYQDSARSILWGDTVGTNTVAGTGSGAAVSHTVYGRVPAQTTPAAGLYTDTITVTVTY